MNVYVFDTGSICIHGKELLRQFAFHQKYREKLTLKQMFEISEKLTVEQSGEIFAVSQISWEDSLHKQLSLVNDEEKTVYRMQRFMYSQTLCYVLER